MNSLEVVDAANKNDWWIDDDDDDDDYTSLNAKDIILYTS